jgi:glycosyltransferase involved in cell wall biosynthesis
VQSKNKCTLKTLFKLQRFSVFTYNLSMKLSVITPTHNRMGLLEGLLKSLEAQTYTDFEVVVAVDGSSDGTLTLLEAYKRRARFELEVLVLPQGGQAKARNRAIKQSKGDVLVFADDDLTLMPDVLARHAALHQVFPNTIAIAPVQYPNNEIDFPRQPSWVNFTGMNTSLPRQAALQVGGFDEQFSGYGGEDLEFALRLSKKGLSLRRLPDALALHHGTRHRNPEKGYSAGFQAVRIAQKHGGGVAMQLGVHPNLLTAKRLAFNPLGRVLLGSRADYAFEEAYFHGARDAWQKIKAE